ncbi:MAG TPA: MBL fold metallo-hydrolase [Fimbriiglobus sp.]|jgi:phosphoribosyl 1,2-cyclic phosphodiesterase
MRDARSCRFVVLASGSGGNAAVIETGAGCLLVDFGLPPRTLERKLKMVGLGWSRIRVAVLTHTHSDHWKRETLSKLVELGIPVFSHPDHCYDLARAGDTFAELKRKELLKPFAVNRPFEPLNGVSALPIAVPHDSDPTVAFRLDGDGWAIGYAADLGTARPDLLAAFDGVTVLGLEFNHDEQMQRTSRRPAFLIERVLGDRGHLSNGQAAGFLSRMIERCGEKLRHVVQLHLSRECNRPALAAAAARTAIAGTSIEITTAGQDIPTPFLPLGQTRVASQAQPLLPGLDL